MSSNLLQGDCRAENNLRQSEISANSNKLSSAIIAWSELLIPVAKTEKDLSQNPQFGKYSFDGNH